MRNKHLVILMSLTLNSGSFATTSSTEYEAFDICEVTPIEVGDSGHCKIKTRESQKLYELSKVFIPNPVLDCKFEDIDLSSFLEGKAIKELIKEKKENKKGVYYCGFNLTESCTIL